MPHPFPQTFESIIQIIDDLLVHAVSMRASDIHCDPGDRGLMVRLRIDGQIEHAGIIPRSFHEELIARLKILCNARTDLHAAPQDGRWRTEIAGEPYQIRASFMPTYHGENVVMRLLSGRVSDDISLARLGFTPDHVRSIYGALSRTSGLILVTGPTGSGKTTTLHACLSLKVREPLSIITLEDPVEYEIPGVRQVHIRHSFGVTFASGLRSALRQDPDVIMLGEIRDAETARVAIHTALTGHLVLSTLHTNNALEAITRLVDMGIDHYLLASTLRLIVAQRLVRVQCPSCLSEGCELCLQTGYKGRSVIAEVCEVDTGLKKLIAHKHPVSTYREYVRGRGFCPMEEDGHEKVEWGVTTTTEIARVLYE